MIFPDNMTEREHIHREDYVKHLHATIFSIEQAWQALEQAWSEETVAAIEHLVGMLGKSASTVGFLSIHETARALAEIIDAIDTSGHPPNEEQRAQVGTQIEIIKQTANELDRRVLIDSSDLTIPSDLTPRYLADNRRVLLVERDVSAARELAHQIEHYGYIVQLLHGLEDVPRLVETTMPAAIILDMAFPEAAWTIAGIQQGRPNRLPVIYTSNRSDLEARLQALRAGGDAYFVRPIDAGMLADKLDELLGQRHPEPYRILIVEDGLTMANYYAAVLQQAEMITMIVTDPLKIIRPLNEFRPDLILMDMYMPGCTGLELAAVIRQQKVYHSIPIVFLSVEKALDMQLAAMGLGGDDFLTKPIQPEHLVAVVTARACRARSLHSFMLRDSLTGLFNHATTKAYLEIEVERARRYQAMLSFAVIDIDHFKHVNDTYGHPVGDHVIRVLARLLQQRLRKSDIVGRYGGEEFAVILPEADGLAAFRLMDELRARFANLQQFADDALFSVTFSCGIASFPHYNNALWLTDAADKALYEAKRNGRNRIIVAGP